MKLSNEEIAKHGLCVDQLGVVPMNKPKPKIVCICGSSRFVAESAVKAWEFEKSGLIALSMHLLPSWYSNVEHHLAEHEGVEAILDELHLRKIEMADYVYVMNLPIPGHENGYIGERTNIEINHALKCGKAVQFHTVSPRPSLPV